MDLENLDFPVILEEDEPKMVSKELTPSTLVKNVSFLKIEK